MTYEVILVSADEVHPDDYLDLVEALGGERRPDEWTGARLSRENRHVWVSVAPDWAPEFDPEVVAEHEEKLGAPARTSALLAISSTAGSEEVAMEIVRAAGRRWHVIVDDNHGGLHTVAELDATPAAKLPFGR